MSDYEAAKAQDWARCRHWIVEALERDGGFHRIEDVEELIFGGNAHFWPGLRSAAVTQWVHYPTGKTLNVWLAGGDLNELVNDMLPAGEVWAKERGCTRVLLYGRKGWERALAPMGFRHHTTLLIKEFG